MLHKLLWIFFAADLWATALLLVWIFMRSATLRNRDEKLVRERAQKEEKQASCKHCDCFDHGMTCCECAAVYKCTVRLTA